MSSAAWSCRGPGASSSQARLPLLLPLPPPSLLPLLLCPEVGVVRGLTQEQVQGQGLWGR